jgi:hypothetical protein
MRPMICENIAPPEVFAIIHELSIGDEAAEFVRRTLNEAEVGEGLSTFNANGEPNSRTITLMFMMQARMTGEFDRTKLLEESGLATDISDDNSDDLVNWDGIALAMLFASDWLLDRMISNLPPEVRSTIISQMPTEQHGLARSMFTT